MSAHGRAEWRAAEVKEVDGMAGLAGQANNVTCPASHLLHSQLMKDVWRYPQVLYDSFDLIRFWLAGKWWVLIVNGRLDAPLCSKEGKMQAGSSNSL